MPAASRVVVEARRGRPSSVVMAGKSSAGVIANDSASCEDPAVLAGRSGRSGRDAVVVHAEPATARQIAARDAALRAFT
jgi:hypothetical protein